MMLLLQAHLTVFPDQREAFLDLVERLVLHSRVEEGCLAFGCYEDPFRPGTFMVLEEWVSREALDRHEASSHLAAFKAAAGAMFVAESASRVFTISAVGGVDGRG